MPTACCNGRVARGGRRRRGEPRFLDEREMALQAEARQQELKTYRAYREQVEQRREQDRLDRNEAKVKQLELFEGLQVGTAGWRGKTGVPTCDYSVFDDGSIR